MASNAQHALFKKIPQRKVSDRVCDQVQELIAEGRLRPGERLPSERELTALFDVSRSSVREAILKLECLGFVEQRHGEGTFIKSVTDAPLAQAGAVLVGKEDFLFDLMEVRNELETWAAALAAERASDAEIQEMREIIAAMAAAREERARGHEMNFRLHFLISRAGGNRFLPHIMETISDWIKRVTHAVYADLYDDRAVYDHLLDQHRAIVEAIASRDPEAASQAMEKHLRFAVEAARRDPEKMAAT
jgi:GntR family transcriptional repressor for pyruvate dehydrogenase complex